MLLGYTQVTYTSAPPSTCGNRANPSAYRRLGRTGDFMPSAHRSCHLGLFEHKSAVVAACWAVLSFLFFAPSAQAQVTLLVPSQPSIEAPTPPPTRAPPPKPRIKKTKNASRTPKQHPARQNNPLMPLANSRNKPPLRPQPKANPRPTARPPRQTPRPNRNRLPPHQHPLTRR